MDEAYKVPAVVPAEELPAARIAGKTSYNFTDSGVQLVPGETGAKKALEVLDLEDAVYKTKKEKYKAVVDEIVKAHETGQPVLVGTINIDTSEMFNGCASLTSLEILRLTGLPDDWNIPDWATENFIRQVIGEGFPPKFSAKLLETMPKGRD